MNAQQPGLFTSESVALDADPTGAGLDSDVMRSHNVQRFDGATFDPNQDGDRLTRQLDAVRRLMLDAQWRTLAEIAVACGYGEAAVASISARLRDLRKSKFGAHDVERRRRSAGSGTWEYRVRKGSGQYAGGCS
jgi:hypothetical protein